MLNKTIPWATSRYWGNEQRYVLDALQSSWISGGAYVDRLEADFARYCDSPYAVTASNGTAALHMAYLALDIGLGDEVIVPGFGFMAAANVALHVGAKPVFAEVCPASWCMTADAVEKCITSKTKAIVPVHTYGNVCDMDPLLALAKKYGLLVIEDAAESIGSKYKGRMSGTLGSVGTYSFHATKTITTGEGGAVVTDSVEIRDQMQLFRSHGMSSRRYWHVVAGHNFRLANIHAAIGCAQLERIDDITKERARVYDLYKKLLSNIDGVTLQFFSESVEPVVWAIAVKLDPIAFPQGRDGVIIELKERGVECRPGFYSADFMPHLYGDISLPVCRELSQQILSLPSGPALTNTEIEYACESFKSRRK